MLRCPLSFERAGGTSGAPAPPTAQGQPSTGLCIVERPALVLTGFIVSIPSMSDPPHLAFPLSSSTDQERPKPTPHPVVIVGAGPAGLAAALGLAARGQASTVIDRKGGLSEGS